MLYKLLTCNFCGLTQNEVEVIVTGPGVYACVDSIQEKRQENSKSNPLQASREGDPVGYPRSPT